MLFMIWEKLINECVLYVVSKYIYVFYFINLVRQFQWDIIYLYSKCRRKEKFGGLISKLNLGFCNIIYV